MQFTTGLELFQAMIGGSIDMLATGAVISNFPARGQGKMFLINNVEFATAQLWVREDQGVKSFADLKGKKISTTTGTTAHVFLDNALRANNIGAGDVEIVNQRMSEAVTSFISGAVPAVALWVPFNITVKAEGAGGEDAGRRVGLLPEGGDRRRLGDARRLLREEPRRPARASSAAGPRRTTTSSRTPTRRSTRCRRSATSRCRSPSSRSSTARRRCSRRPSGARCTPTAR